MANRTNQSLGQIFGLRGTRAFYPGLPAELTVVPVHAALGVGALQAVAAGHPRALVQVKGKGKGKGVVVNANNAPYAAPPKGAGKVAPGPKAKAAPKAAPGP